MTLLNNGYGGAETVGLDSHLFSTFFGASDISDTSEQHAMGGALYDRLICHILVTLMHAHDFMPVKIDPMTRQLHIELSR
jgi:hypothetical protein